MKTSTTLLNPMSKTQKLSQAYEIIENERLTQEVFNSLTVSGALFSLSTFETTSFSSCVFYGMKMENCIFKNCHFENCNFEFSNVYGLTFISCTFKNCTWEYTHARKTTMKSCGLDRSTSFALSKDESNKIENCYTIESELTETSLNLIELYDKWLAA